MNTFRTLIAPEGKIFAYRDENGEEVKLGTEIYLGKEDDGSRYYLINKEE